MLCVHFYGITIAMIGFQFDVLALNVIKLSNIPSRVGLRRRDDILSYQTRRRAFHCRATCARNQVRPNGIAPSRLQYTCASHILQHDNNASIKDNALSITYQHRIFSQAFNTKIGSEGVCSHGISNPIAVMLSEVANFWKRYHQYRSRSRRRLSSRPYRSSLLP